MNDRCTRHTDRSDSTFLSSLPLAQSTIDYDVASRGDERLIERLMECDSTRIVLVRNASVAVPLQEGTHAVGELACSMDPAAPRPDAQAPTGPMKLAFLRGPQVRACSALDMCLSVLLGWERAVDPAVPFVALDVSGVFEGDDSLCTHSVLRLFEHLDWVELRSFAPCASARDAGLATSAVAVCTWHRQQRFCPFCGSPVRPIMSGWAQTCTNPNDSDRLLFPRIEPAVITAIVDDDDRLLLQHNRAWRPHFHSVSAGFVEAGESLERAVRREAAEEVGVTLDDVHYLGSQPWPFPASIMLGFRAHAATTQIRVDHDEVESARWFTRAELARAIASGEVEPPGRASIARHMIEQWYGGSLPA